MAKENGAKANDPFADLVKRKFQGSVGSVAGQVISYDTDKNTAVVRPLGFEKRLGDEITVRLGRTDKNKNSPDIHEMATGTEDSRMKTPVGGILQLDGLRQKGDVYEAAWISLLAKEPEKSPVYANVPVRISETRNRNGDLIIDKRGSRMFAVDIYHIDTAAKAETVDDLVKAVTERLGSGQVAVRGDNLGVAVGVLKPDGALVHRMVHTVGYDREAEAPRSVEKAVEGLFARYDGGREQLDAIVAAGGTFEVFSTSRLFVGGKTAQEIEKASKDVDDFRKQGSRKIDLGQFAMGQTESGNTIFGTALANVVVKPFENGAIVSHLKKSTRMRPVPLIAIDTEVAPDAYKGWKAAEEERKASAAAEAGEDAEAKADDKTANEEIGATVDTDADKEVSAILDDFEDDDDAPQM